MAKGVIGVAIAVALSLVAGLIALAYPLLFKNALTGPYLDIDPAEGRTKLDSRIALELRGSFSEEDIRQSLQIEPAVPLDDVDLAVDRVARFPWHERFPWAKTKVVINPRGSQLFEPETTYTVALKDRELSFETITLPRVTDVHVGPSPDSGSENVPTSSPVVLTFNEEVLWHDRYLDVEPSTPVAVTTETTAAGAMRLRVTPEERWENSTEYVLTVLRGVEDVDGHRGQDEFSFSFTTWPRPTVVEMAPYGGGLPVDSAISVRFERPVDRASVEQSFEVEPSIEGSFQWKDNSLLEWRPDRLDYSTTYTVFVGGKAAGGDPLIGTGWSFATRPQPKVLRAGPKGESLPPDEKIKIEFDREVDRKSVERAFHIEPAVSGRFAWAEDGGSVTWSPAGLAYSTSYTVSVEGRSVQGDPIIPQEWMFETQDPPLSLDILGDEQSPTTLTAVASGGTGEYSYEWDSGDTTSEVSVDVSYEETQKFTVTVSSGDQTATGTVTVHGPPSPCPGWQVISEEVCYKEETLAGPVQVSLSRVDLSDLDVQVSGGLTTDHMGRVGTVRASALAEDSLISVNGDFSAAHDGGRFALGPIISNGNLVYAPDHPGYGPDLPGVVLALGREGGSWVGGEQELKMSLRPAEGSAFPLEHINSIPDANQLALFNAYWGQALSLDRGGCYATLAPAEEGGAVWRSEVSCESIEDIPLDDGEFVLFGTGRAVPWLKENAGKPLTLETSFPVEDLDFAIGGSHALIRDGELPELNPYLGSRHPRTAIGVDGEGFLYLVVVDGRSQQSRGMTLEELQQYLKDLGLVDAINLDGGGSSTMVRQGSVVNTPSDGSERPVPTLVAVTGPQPECPHELVRCKTRTE